LKNNEEIIENEELNNDEIKELIIIRDRREERFRKIIDHDFKNYPETVQFMTNDCKVIFFGKLNNEIQNF